MFKLFTPINYLQLSIVVYVIEFGHQSPHVEKLSIANTQCLGGGDEAPLPGGPFGFLEVITLFVFIFALFSL